MDGRKIRALIEKRYVSRYSAVFHRDSRYDNRKMGTDRKLIPVMVD